MSNELVPQYAMEEPVTLDSIAEQNESILQEMRRLREDIRFLNVLTQQCHRSIETIAPSPEIKLSSTNGLLKAARITATIAAALAVLLIVLLAYGRAAQAQTPTLTQVYGPARVPPGCRAGPVTYCRGPVLPFPPLPSWPRWPDGAVRTQITTSQRST